MVITGIYLRLFKVPKSGNRSWKSDKKLAIECTEVSARLMSKPPQRDQGPSVFSLTDHHSTKLTSSQFFHPTVESNVVHGTTLIFIRSINDFRIKWILQDEKLDNMLKTTYFCDWCPFSPVSNDLWYLYP